MPIPEPDSKYVRVKRQIGFRIFQRFADTDVISTVALSHLCRGHDPIFKKDVTSFGAIDPLAILFPDAPLMPGASYDRCTIGKRQLVAFGVRKMRGYRKNTNLLPVRRKNRIPRNQIPVLNPTTIRRKNRRGTCLIFVVVPRPQVQMVVRTG